jgi:uncharacterized protein YndB with AHSA1/START domain
VNRMVYLLAMTDTRTFEHSLTVDAPRDRVFHAITDADELKRWWITDGISEPRPGGRFRFEWKMADPSNDHVQEGAYDEVVDGQRIAFPWAGPAGDSHVTLSLSEGDGGTQVSLVHSGIAADDMFERYEQGWQGFLANLKSVLEAGQDNRAAMGVQTLA